MVEIDDMTAMSFERFVAVVTTPLAERRPTDPAGVIDPYRRLVDRIMAEFHDKRRYAKTACIPVRLKAAYAAYGDRAGFDAYLAKLRIEHKRRPNFLVELDRTKGLR